MADRESTAVGYRLRMQPPDLSTYPDAVKLQWFEWVTELGLDRKLKELRKGWDKNGKTHPLKPRTIKYRKSEVGSVHKRAPRGIPALDVSRVMALLTGRAHLSSAEFWWGFDSVTGRSFAEILHYWADDQGHDVFGLSPQGMAWVTAQALKKWAAWKAAGGYTKPAVNVPGARAIPKIAVRRQVRKIEIPGRMDLENIDLAGNEAEIRRAMAAGRFTGFRRLNMRGEQWKPGAGIPVGQMPARPQIAAMKPALLKPPKPKAYSIEYTGTLPTNTIERHERLIQRIPEPVLNALKAKGIKFSYADRLIDRHPELAQEKPSGWGGDLTWENADGIYYNSKQEIFVSRTLKGEAGYYESSRQAGVLYHETGHGLDAALGYRSRQKDWQEAHAKDAARLGADDQLRLSYFIQAGYRGWEEVFAELFGFEQGAASGGEDIRPFFPECLKLLRETIKALP